MPKEKKKPETKAKEEVKVQPEEMVEIDALEALRSEFKALRDYATELEAKLEGKSEQKQEARTLIVPVPGKGIIFGVEGMGVTYVPGGKVINGKIQ
jgi:hypothetical protein